MRRAVSAAFAVILCAAGPFPASGPEPLAGQELPADPVESELQTLVTLFTEDRAALERRWDVPYSANRQTRLREFLAEWQARLAETPFDALGREGQVDYVLLENRLRYELETLDREAELLAEMAGLVPFLEPIAALQETRREHAPVDAPAAAAALEEIARMVDRARSDARALADNGVASPTPAVALRASQTVGRLRGVLSNWYGFYEGYDPIFTWWARVPHERADEALRRYAELLRVEVAGMRGEREDAIVGDPIGEGGMRSDLVHEMIPYTAEELIRIAERELAWGEAEMRAAAAEMGYGDDWRAALEHVKTLHVEPGEQPELVRVLAREAEAFLEEHDLVTVPELAKEVWRMEMLSAEAQRTAPFFLGGETVRVAFPTEVMEHEDKLMSIRGNNVHFSRAVVHHELIPGHHLQGYMTRRYNTHRAPFSTPFWGEGWALYWEFLLYEMGFPTTPEDRVGMLFWRNHRAARIIFSLGFHLGTMTPEEAIDFLVERVGHERANAEAEVRRSFAGSYSPLYQAAYMLGGLQFRALHRELVESGTMTNREFHDAILRGGRIPVEMVRARLTDVPLTPGFRSQWRFAGDP